MPYTALTFSQAKALLSARLGDTDFTFWTEEELGLYIKDALRYWSLLSQYYKDRTTFSTTVAQPFYDLSIVIPTFRTQTVLDSDFIKLIQYHLMEPATGTTWTGSEQFTYQSVLDSIGRMRNRLLLDTSTGGRVDLVAATSPPIQRVYLDESTIDVLRVAWKSTTDVYKNLRQRDTVARRSFNPLGSYTPSSPLAYQKADQPHTSIELWPPSNDEGHLEVISSRALGTPTGQGVTLGIPDDFVPVLKWGVLADLLSQERAQDAARAQYCEERYAEGVKAAKLAPSMWAFEVNGRPVSISSLQELDSFKPNWENTAGTPTQAAMVGLDLVAFNPVPDDIYSITCDLTRSALIPASDSEYLQIGKEYLDIFLDYCVHIATFKQGGGVFTGTQPQLEALLKAAYVHNNRLKAQALYLEPITDQSYREARRRPVETNNAVGQKAS